MREDRPCILAAAGVSEGGSDSGVGEFAKPASVPAAAVQCGGGLAAKPASGAAAGTGVSRRVGRGRRRPVVGAGRVVAAVVTPPCSLPLEQQEGRVLEQCFDSSPRLE